MYAFRSAFQCPFCITWKKPPLGFCFCEVVDNAHHNKAPMLVTWAPSQTFTGFICPLDAVWGRERLLCEDDRCEILLVADIMSQAQFKKNVRCGRCRANRKLILALLTWPELVVLRSCCPKITWCKFVFTSLHQAGPLRSVYSVVASI